MLVQVPTSSVEGVRIFDTSIQLIHDVISSSVSVTFVNFCNICSLNFCNICGLNFYINFF